VSLEFEADVLQIHVAAGEGRVSPPPGVLAQGAPRRSARGRSEDLLFLCLNLEPARAIGTARLDQIARLAAQAYFGTSGSVTAALRAAAGAANDHVMDSRGEQGPPRGSLVAAALRGKDLIVAQCGSGQVILVRPGTVARLASQEAAAHPLGAGLHPHVQFRHLELSLGDLLVLTTAEPPIWSDPSLSSLYGLSLPQALDRLVASSPRDLTGLLVRIPRSGEVRPSAAPRTVAAPAGRVAAARAGRRAGRAAPGVGRRTAPTSTGSELPPAVPRRSAGAIRVGRWLQRAAAPLQRAIEPALMAVWRLLARMAPGLAEAERPGGYSPTVLIGTALAIPLVVVAAASLVYFRQGRAQQFDQYLVQAQAAVVAAQLKPSGAEARSDWELARSWLDLAETYRVTETSSSLRSQVQAALDSLELVVRLDLVPTISGGFGARAEITGLAATASDLYALDIGNGLIWHAWATGRGYEIDPEFDCPLGAEAGATPAEPVGIVIQPEPGALGVEGVVAVDRNGGLLYCAPGRSPLRGQLSAPDVGWGRLQAFDVFEGSLYVLDPVTNAVWIYDASDGLFSGTPGLFFAEAVPELETAIDLALAQDELIILHTQGNIDRCRRVVENAPDGSLRIRVECDQNPQFLDERPGMAARSTIPGANPLQMVYSPPPEPSLFFLDAESGSIFHYSMRLVFQAQYRPNEPLQEAVAAITEAPPSDLLLAAGGQVYYAQLRR
jgi:hypothetical protein